MVEGRADVEAVTGAKLPRISSVGLVVDKNFASKGGKWCGVVAIGAVEVLPGGYGRIKFSLVE